jgi:aspartate/methionine/tyrosine aminotransferase
MSSFTSSALRPFGTTIFTTMTRLAQQHGAVNLSQGFPDFDGPGFVKDAAARAMRELPNQYAPMPGVPALRQQIAARFERDTGMPADADTMVTVTAGCTEAIAATMLGLCNPGDEVILFEPFYDSYRACVAMAGCVPRVVSLKPRAGGAGSAAGMGGELGEFTFDEDELWDAFTENTRAIVINSPHNPTGKVFTQAELEVIANLCQKHDCLAICDEVYERLLFDAGERPHVSLASLPGMAERTVTLSSLGKTFSLTGWKIGWAVAPAAITAGIRAAHQFLTFAVATPLQHAAAEALAREGEYVPGLVADLRLRRDELNAALRGLGFATHLPRAGYFIIADHSKFGFHDDAAFCKHLIEQIGVAAIPPSVFYERAELGHKLVRFAFCKKPETIAEGIRRLQKLKGAGG